jgi:hypothetical protein
VLDGNHAAGVAYCVAHHVKVDGSARSLMVAAIRYLDTYVKDDGVWYFSQRKLMVDWTETRSLNAGSGVNRPTAGSGLWGLTPGRRSVTTGWVVLVSLSCPAVGHSR